VVVDSKARMPPNTTSAHGPPMPMSRYPLRLWKFTAISAVGA
jgi:hypothetical protein